MTNPPGDGEPPADPYGRPSGQPPAYPSQGQYGGGYDAAQGYGGGYGGQPGYGYPGAPPVDHPRATTALVLGILGFVLCGILSPFAWRIGKGAVDEIDASNGRMGGRGAAQAGYVLGLIGTILLGLALLVVVGVIAIGIIGVVGSSTSSG